MVDFNTLGQFIVSAGGAAIGAGVLKGPITSLNDWWYYQFGSKSELKRQEAQLLNQARIDSYKEEIFSEVKNIPAQNIKEPQLDIIGPALEASKYYINEPELRKMFAKLVASSMNSEVKGVTRSAFVEFVKQMDSVDAQLLAYVAKEQQVPIARIKNIFSGSNRYRVLFSSLLANDIPMESSLRASIPSSVQNLARMNLIKVDYSEYISDFEYDQEFSKTPEYMNIEDSQVQSKKQYQMTLNQSEKHPESLNLSQDVLDNMKKMIDTSLKIDHGLIQMTPLGKDFAKICL